MRISMNITNYSWSAGATGLTSELAQHTGAEMLEAYDEIDKTVSTASRPASRRMPLPNDAVSSSCSASSMRSCSWPAPGRRRAVSTLAAAVNARDSAAAHHRRATRHPVGRPGARDRVRTRRCRHAGVRASGEWPSDSRRPLGEDDRGRATAKCGLRRSGRAEFLVAALEELELGQRRFDKIFAVRVGLFHREPERAHDLARGGSPGRALSAFLDSPG